jgi:uncharacterized protein
MENLTRDEIKKIIVSTLLPWGVLRISLFGSYSRQQESLNSDIDILVLLPAAKDRKLIGLRWFSLDKELEEKIGRRIDLVSEDALSPSLRPVIEKDLEVIYEKTG